MRPSCVADTEMPQPNCPWGSQAGTAVIGPDGLPIFVGIWPIPYWPNSPTN